MGSCAQTNAQLFLEMQERGCSSAELRLVRDAYLLSMQLTAGIFTGSGKTTLAHDVGTASLALRHGGSAEHAAAGVLHSAYVVGEWGHWGRRATAANRETVRRVIGARAESWVYGLSRLPWNPAEIASLAERAPHLDEVGLDTAFLKLLEDLDRLLDYGAILWFRNAEGMKANLRDHGDPMCRLAERLGKPALAAELRKAIDLTLTANLPDELLGLAFPGGGTPMLIPASCRRRPILHLYRVLRSRAARLSHRLRRPGAGA